jgi:hypothetical protein
MLIDEQIAEAERILAAWQKLPPNAKIGLLSDAAPGMVLTWADLRATVLAILEWRCCVLHHGQSATMRT